MHQECLASLTFRTRLLVIVFSMTIGCDSQTPSDTADGAGSGSTSSSSTTVDEVAEISDFKPIDEVTTAPSENTAGNTQLTESDNNPGTDTAIVSAVPSPPIPTESQIAKWSVPTYEPIQLLSRRRSDQHAFIACSAATSDGSWYVLGGDKLTLWRALETTPVSVLWEFPMSASAPTITALAIAPNNEWIAAGDSTGQLKIFHLKDQKEVASKKIFRNDLVQIAISDDSNEIAVVTFSGEVQVLDASKLDVKSKFKANGYAKLCYIGPSKLAVAGQALQVWNTEAGTVLETILEGGYSHSVTRSKDLAWYAIATDDQLRLVHVADPSKNRQFPGKFAINEMIEFSENNSRLWTANGSNVRLWDVQRGALLQVIDVLGSSIVALDYLPKEQLLRVVNESGVFRVWGTAKDGEVVGLKPLHVPIALTDSANPEPATEAQLLEAIDLRTFPQPPNSKSGVGESWMIQLETTEPIDELKGFYRYHLGQRGWVEQPLNSATPDYFNFDKNGFRVFLSIDSTGSSTYVRLTNLGNVNVGQLPKLDGNNRTTLYEDRNTTMYKVKSTLLEAEVGVLKLMSANGWKPYARLNSSHNEAADSRMLQFIRNSMTIHATLRVDASDPSIVGVQYSGSVAELALPAPDECDYLECDTGRSPALIAFTNSSFDDCQSFYDRVLIEQGWLPSGMVETTQKDFRWLSYYRGMNDVTLQLSTVEDGRTLISSGEHAVSNSWQIAKAKPEDVEGETSKQKAGIEAADLPIFQEADASELTFDPKAEEIRITIPKNSHIEIIDFYAKAFGDLGWKERPNGFRAEDYGFVTFEKDDVDISLRVNSSASLNTTTYSLSDDGILWTKPLPTRNELISYEAWLRKHDHPATMKLIGSYYNEMKDILTATP